MSGRRISVLIPITSFVFVVSLTFILPHVGLSQSAQPPAQTYNEALTVYLGNLARRQNGLPPLRWNYQLTEAARWFSWDSVEKRPAPYCGHQDTQGHWPDWRAGAFGYRGYAGAENAFCGYMTPEEAIKGWLNSPGHRANLLDPNSRELGLGYYLRESDHRGYITQDFGHDPVYPPVIIENEAITTTSPSVNLYIYDREPSGGFAGLGPAVQMMISHDPCFTGATWQPYTAEKTWTLEPGQGWRSVYVKTRDVLSRTVIVSDTIYLGQNVPLVELGAAQMSTTQGQITLSNLTGGEWPMVQFSLDWLVNDTLDTFALKWGNGERVSDAEAWGGTAFRLSPGTGESFAWVWTTDFIKETPLVAYFRLKVSGNSSPTEVARISVWGGGTEYGPVSLRGADFTAANHYQEFPVAFKFHQNANDPFLIFKFWRSGSTNVFVDSVSIFTAPQPLTATTTWTVPGGNYRGQGVWVRYTDGESQFSPITEANLNPLEVSPDSLTFLAGLNEGPPLPQLLKVRSSCQTSGWQVRTGAPWLKAQVIGDTIQVSINQVDLSVGAYQSTLVTETTQGTPLITVPVTLIVAEQLYRDYLPVILHN